MDIQENNIKQNITEYNPLSTEGSFFDYSVIIPAYNEGGRIGPVLLDISNFFRQNNINNYELIVVDDGSKDNTADTVNLFNKEINNLRLIALGKNCGKGYAVKTGVLNSRGSQVLFMDADGSTPIKEILKLSKLLQNHHIAIGSRHLSRELIDSDQPLYRKIVGIIGKRLRQTLFLKKIEDTQCGFKMFRADIAKILFSKLSINGFGFDMEILAAAEKRGYKIIEVPVVWSHVGGSKLNVFPHSMIMAVDLLRIYYKIALGRHR